MSGDSSDEDFSFGTLSIPGFDKDKGKCKGKGKTAAGKSGKQKGTSMSSSMSDLDALVAESEKTVVRTQKVKTIMDLGDDILDTDQEDVDEQKARTDATEARDKRIHKAILEDTSIEVPGAIQVFDLSQSQAPPDLRFSVPSSATEFSVLVEAVKRSEGHPEDLEELLRGGVVPWVTKKFKGTAPPEVCRWLLRLVCLHEVPAIVMAAEEALLGLLAEAGKVWRLRYEDTVDIWRGCGAVWLASAGGNAQKEEKGEEEDDYDESDDEATAYLRINLRSALTVVEGCLLRGAHEMNPDELRDMLRDLAAASLDKGVSGSCQAEVDRALVAVVNAIPAGQYEDDLIFSSMVDSLCNLCERGLKSRMTPLSWVLLAKNLPIKRPSSPTGSNGHGVVDDGKGGSEVATADPVKTSAHAVPSLRHEVCHRLLTEQFLSKTSYAKTDESPEGLGRALKALEVLLDDEDNLLEDESQQGYERQYVVIALATEMAAASVAVSQTGKPDPEESKIMLKLLDELDGQLIHVMQRRVQMSKTLISLTKSKYTPYLPVGPARQSKLSFEKSGGVGVGSSVGESNSHGDKNRDEKAPRAESQ